VPEYSPAILGIELCGKGVFEEGSQAGVVDDDGLGIGVPGVSTFAGLFIGGGTGISFDTLDNI
jgi:hypothetical protein